MAQLIRVTLAQSGHVETMMSEEVSVNVRSIVLVEDYHGTSEARTRILLENGKSLLVIESQEEIRDLANSANGVL
jgi:hypothetical protein